MRAADRIQHSCRDLLVIGIVNIIDTETNGVQIGSTVVLFCQHCLHIGRGKLRHKAVANVAVAAAAVGVVVRNSSKLIGCVSRCAVAHQNDGGGAVGGVGGILEIRLPCFPQAALNVGAAFTGNRGSCQRAVGADCRCIGCICATLFAATAFAAIVGRSRGLNAGRDAAIAEREVMVHTVAVHIDTGVMVQGKQGADLIGAGVQDHTHTVIVAFHQGADGVISSGGHGAQSRIVHGAGDVQHEHGIRGLGALTDHHGIGAQCGQGYKKVILPHAQPGNSREGCCDILAGKHGLVRPDTAGMLRRGHTTRQEGVPPCVHGAGVCHNAALDHIRLYGNSGHYGKHQHDAQQHSDEALRNCVDFHCHFNHSF